MAKSGLRRQRGRGQRDYRATAGRGAVGRAELQRPAGGVRLDGAGLRGRAGGSGGGERGLDW